MGGEGGDSLRWGKHTERAAEGTQGWSGGGFGQVWAMSLAAQPDFLLLYKWFQLF